MDGFGHNTAGITSSLPKLDSNMAESISLGQKEITHSGLKEGHIPYLYTV